MIFNDCQLIGVMSIILYPIGIRFVDIPGI
jgi:hypothetical protein